MWRIEVGAAAADALRGSPRSAPGRAACRRRRVRRRHASSARGSWPRSPPRDGRSPDSRHLMSTNFWKPMSDPKPASVHDGVDQLQRDAVGDDRRVAMGDVGERPGVDEGRSALERLDQVRLDGLAHQHGHGAGNLELVERHRFAVVVLADDDAAEAAGAGRGCRRPARGSP